jgi:hypothetical protein
LKPSMLVTSCRGGCACKRHCVTAWLPRSSLTRRRKCWCAHRPTSQWTS